MVLTDPDSFPTDLYMTESAAALAGLEVRRVHPRDAVAAIAEVGDDLALASYSSVDYRTGELWDLRAITEAAHAVGALALLGPLPLGRASSRSTSTRAAPTSPSAAATSTSTAVRARPPSSTSATRHQDDFDQPLTGWQGHAHPFEMRARLRAGAGITRARVGTPPCSRCSPSRPR